MESGRRSIFSWFCCPRCGKILGIEREKIHNQMYCPLCSSAFKKQEMVVDHSFDDDAANSYILLRIDFKYFKQVLRKRLCLNSPQYNKSAYYKREKIERESEYRSSHQPKCISCGSTNVNKIAVTSKLGSILLWGVFAAGRTSKTYHCNNCGTEW